MANINDYLNLRGDILIDKDHPFNNLDAIILARFSYLLFDKINLEDIETIETISIKMKDFKDEEFNYHGDKDLITNLGKSNRFKNMEVTDYVKNNDEKIEEQFSAITIHINKKLMYLSFIGTDNTILGYKEDFNLSFMKNIPAQVEGLNYTKNISKKYSKKELILGGHSKGGNIAVYASLEVDDKIKKKIKNVYNLDGPGFHIDFVNKNKNDKMLDRIITVIPKDSVIGRVLEHLDDYEVVESIERGLYQHDIYSWQVNKDDIVKLKKVTNASEIFNKTMRKWLSGTIEEQRKIFIDNIFDIFYRTDALTFSEMSHNLRKNLPKMIGAYKEISEEDKKTIINMIKSFGKSYMIILTQNKRSKINKDIKKEKLKIREKFHIKSKIE